MQLVKPNLSVIGELGYCLHYAGAVFGIFSGPATAWLAWEATKHKHTDQNFPKNVSFPVWFSGAGGAGHVAVFTPNGIYSSPYNTPSGHAVLSSIAEVEQNYGVKYVGWSEDIEGKRVIEEIPMDTNHIKHEVGRQIFVAWGRDATATELTKYVGQVTSGQVSLPVKLQQILDDAQTDAWIAKMPSSNSAVTLKPGLYQVN